MTDPTADEVPAARPNPLGRLVELAVFAPVGLVAGWKEQLPAYVRQGRQAVENRVQVARWIGEMVVQQGQKELAKRLEAQREQRRVAETSGDHTSESSPSVADDGVAILDEASVDEVAVDEVAVDEIVVDEAPTVPAVASEPVAAPAADDLPIDGYESLAALQVVQRLGSLDATELEQVRQFEAAHRARRTILAKVAQLQGDAV